ncbi:MAG: glycosyltransferase family 8 protein [Aphanocapsa sp. GSE-SYN-MK-11-07L]|jgi:lipopolysaccharide biosynthesis glycosyltransferase|nr:glycosyltransferase family 8 protein [Aphanocapsa sp. GSE-SYN-MK-11-07L]
MIVDTDSLNFEKPSQSSQEKETIFAVCAADDRYAMPLSVMARSAIENLKEDFSLLLFIIDGGITKKNKQKILKTLSSEKCEVVFIDKPDGLTQNLEQAYQYTVTAGKAKDYISIAQYYRLLIAELLPEQAQKAIYLDSDLVIQGNLGQLWQADLNNNYVLAAQDTWVHSVSAANGLLNYRELGISPDSKYFNSGVLVINIKKWRAEKVFMTAANYLNQYKDKIIYGDQDVLNAIFAGQWGELNPRWNVTARVYEYKSWEESPYSKQCYNELTSQDPYIIHYVSGEKPWNSDHVPMKEHFFRYLDMTAWSGWRFTFWTKLRLNLEYKLRKLIGSISVLR